MIDLRWFEAVPPRDASVTEVTALVRVLAGRSHYGLRKLQPIVTFETWLHPEGVRWLVGIEARIARSLRGTLLSQLPGLTLTPTNEPRRPEPVTAREVRFTSLAYPLRTDTAAGVTAGIVQAREQLRQGEAIVVQWLVGPSHRYVRQPVERTPLDLLGFTTPREPDAGDRHDWKQKVAEPLLGVRGRLGAVAAEPRWAGALLRPVLSALALANGNRSQVRASQQSSRTALQLVQVMGRSRTWPGMVNAAELAVLLGWSINGLDLPGIANGFGPPPSELLNSGRPDSRTTAERPLGTSAHPATRGALLTMPLSAYAANSLVIGPSGSGKSTLCVAWGLAEAEANRSLVVIEPKGDLVTDILARLPKHRHRDVVVIDPGADGALPVSGINPLAGPRDEAERRADSLLHLFKELFGTAIGPRSSDVLLHVLLIASRLDDGALTDVLPLLTNPGFRRWAVGKVGDPLVINPWVAWFDQLSDGERTQVVAPIANKVRVFTSRPSIRRLLGQSVPKFTLDSVFAMPRIVLVNVNSGAIGPQTGKIIGSLVLSQLWEAIQRQTTRPMHTRRTVSVIVDEWQTATAGLDFADVLARSRGAGAPFTLANQHLDQLSPSLKAAALSNARTTVVFRPAEGDARALARVLGDDVRTEDLERLPAFHAAARVLVDGAPSRAFEVATPPLAAPRNDVGQLRLLSAQQYGVDPAELDDQILKRWQGGDTAPDAPIGMRRRQS